MQRIYKNNKGIIRNAAQSESKTDTSFGGGHLHDHSKQLSYRKGKWDDMSLICEHKPICMKP